MIRKVLLVLAGGFCGAITRYLLAKPFLAAAAMLPGAHAGFPYDTLLINLSGAFAIGLLFGAFEQGAPISPDARLALGTGFLGAYTTFSSYMVGVGAMLRQGQALGAMLYLLGAMAGGVALAYAGFALAGFVIARQRTLRLATSASLVVAGDGVGNAVPANAVAPDGAATWGEDELVEVGERAG